MIRLILRTTSHDGSTNRHTVSHHTIDMDLPELEKLLVSGGFSEDSYKITELIDAEIINQ